MRSKRAPRAHTTPVTAIKINGRRLLTQVNIGNTVVCGAIDTVSTRSFIGRELANKIARYGRRKRVTEAKRLADGTNTRRPTTRSPVQRNHTRIRNGEGDNRGMQRLIETSKLAHRNMGNAHKIMRGRITYGKGTGNQR